MTAQPHPRLFDSLEASDNLAGHLMHPNVTEHFWGYEIRSNEQVVGVAALFRAVCGFLTVTLFAAAIGVWIVPAASFIGDAAIAKTFAMLMLMALALVFGRIAARGSRVRVQVDTTAGEFREVVDGALGKEMVLARYGFDTVKKIDVVTARRGEAFGQVQVTFKFDHRIPVGDGGVVLLGPLRSRLASDCGVDGIRSARDTVWAGPLRA